MKRRSERRVGADEILYQQRVCSVDRQRTEIVRLTVKAVHVEVPRDARLLRQPRQRRRVVHAVFRHVPICRPFAARDREQSRLEHAQDVGARDRPPQIAAGSLQDELDFLVARARFDWNLFDRRVGRADHRVAMPGNRKHDAAI